MDKRKLDEEKELYQDYIINIWNWKCMLCEKNFISDEIFYRAYFDTDKIDKKLLKSKKNLKHLLCGYCDENIVKHSENKFEFCNICEFEHKIVNKKDVDENNEDEGWLIC